jgi:hypothetical protein
MKTELFMQQWHCSEHLGSNPKLRLDISYAHTKFGVNMSKQTRVIMRRLIFFFSNIDIKQRHVGSNPKLHHGLSYPHTKFAVNRSQQTQVIEQKLGFYF